MPIVTMRLAVPTDFLGLAPLMQDFNDGERIPWRPAAVEPAFARLCDDSSLGFALVAFAGIMPSAVAYAVATYNYDLEFAGRDAFVTELYVSPRVRRLGIAAALLGEVEAEARRNDVRALHLLVWPDNAAAIALYRDTQFETVPRTMMTKTLVTGIGSVVERP